MVTIVNASGKVASYGGKRLEFSDHEYERAEMLVELLNRNAHGGPFELSEHDDPHHRPDGNCGCVDCRPFCAGQEGQS